MDCGEMGLMGADSALGAVGRRDDVPSWVSRDVLVSLRAVRRTTRSEVVPPGRPRNDEHAAATTAPPRDRKGAWASSVPAATGGAGEIVQGRHVVCGPFGPGMNQTFCLDGSGRQDRRLE